MTLISVIVPIYNVEQYLDKCIRTIRNQTFSNLEIILVNDGSPDNSKLIIEKHQSEDSRIKVINKINGGLSSARNAGINLASGDLIAFIDSDDWIDLEMFEKLNQSIQSSNSDIAVCNVRTEFEDGTLKTELKQGIHLPDQFQVNEIPDAFLAFDCFACNKLYKTSLFKEHNILFPLGLLYEDVGTFPRIFIRANKISIVRENLYHYIVRSGAITQTFKLKGLDYLTVTKLVEDDFKNYKDSRFNTYTTPYKITHNFYSLSINCGWIPKNKDRNLAINTLLEYAKKEQWNWSIIKNAKRGNIRFYDSRSKAQRIYYWMFWHLNPVLKVLLSIFHKIK